MRSLYLMIICVLIFSSAFAQKTELKRKVFWGMGSKTTDTGLFITRVDKGGTLEKIGLQPTDLLLELNGINVIQSMAMVNTFFLNAREGDMVTVMYKRKGTIIRSSIPAVGLKKQSSDKIDIIYDWVEFNRGKLRVIVKKPPGSVPTPAILFIPDFPCWTVEMFKKDNNSYGELIDLWANNGYTVVLVEKSGTGDNENTPSCESVDFLTDLRSYSAGYDFMKKLPFVQQENLFIFGYGTGGVIASGIASLQRPKGVITFGTHYRPWSDFWLERLRFHAFLNNADLVITEEWLRSAKKLFYDFFFLRTSPAEIIKDSALQLVAKKFFSGSDHDPEIMGRNWKYWQQLDSFNIPNKWMNVNSWVLSLFGATDYEAYSENDHKMIADVVNTFYPGRAEYLKIDSLDHNAMKRPDIFAVNTGFPFNTQLFTVTKTWLDDKKNAVYKPPAFTIPRDTSRLNLNFLAHILTDKISGTSGKVTVIINWANTNLQWTATDYANRTPKEIICRRGGNCNEERKVVAALLNEVGIKNRMIREINIQPQSEQRQKSSEDLVAVVGPAMSVFGLRHNDHVWLEFYNSESNTWQPADPTTNLVGLDHWTRSRIGFDERPMNKILPTRDMLVPFFIATYDEAQKKIIEDRTRFYLIESFNKVYGKELSKLPSWSRWQNNIQEISPKVSLAFENKYNLHEQTEKIREIKDCYERLRNEYRKLKP